MPVYHILNGDSLFDMFPHEKIEGNIIVFREALIEGPLFIEPNENFFKARANYFAATYNSTPDWYLDKVVPEYEKIKSIPEGATVYLWFEDDLFCQINLWYCVQQLDRNNIEMRLVKPIEGEEFEKWLGFGTHNGEQLIQSFESAEEVAPLQLSIIKDCLKLYMTNDAARILHYVKSIRSVYNVYPLYANVLRAHIKRFSVGTGLSPLEKRISDIIDEIGEDFPKVFKEFFKRYGIYGFGDSQVKTMYDNVLAQRLK